MDLDKVLLIPHLSKELNLIGHNPLPYKITNVKNKNKKGNIVQPEKIVFNYKKMVDALISVCIDMVKQIKIITVRNSEDEIERLTFENIKLEKQKSILNKSVKMKLDELLLEKEKNQILSEELNTLNQKLKAFKEEKNKVVSKCLGNEDVLKHNLKKQELEIQSLHFKFWKKFNLVDKTFIPKNFELVQLNQPDFNKLWSDVKYSRPKTKENALKEAVCILQENNNFLMEDNRFLKHLLFITVDELSKAVEFIQKIIHLKTKISLRQKIEDLFLNIEDFNVEVYKNLVNEPLIFLTNIFKLIETISFKVSDQIFVCWSDVLKEIK